MEIPVKKIDTLAFDYDLTVKDICSALEIDIEEYLDAKKRFNEESN